MAVSSPVIRCWGRLEVRGAELFAPGEPTLVVGNHDSYWDPIAIGIAAKKRRQIRALAKASLWRIRPLAPILNGMGQIPIERAAGDQGALSTAIAHLRAGACIGVFAEGTISRGEQLRARSGVGRLAEAVPEAKIVCVAVRDTVSIVGFPARPRITVEFFEPAGGGFAPGEDPGAFAGRLLGEIRVRAPVCAAGRGGRGAVG